MENYKIELIERYLMNDMTVEEQAEFEALLRKDSELLEEFLFRRKVDEAISEFDVMDLRNSLAEVMAEAKKVKLVSAKKWIYSSVAAAIVVLFVVGSIFVFPGKKIDSNEIFEYYFSPYPAIISKRSGERKEGIRQKALESYMAADYNTAYGHFMKINDLNSGNRMAMFYLAICEIERGNLNNSEQYLYGLTLDNDHIFWEQAHWYLALVYIRQENTEGAKLMLNFIIKNNLCRETDAKEIMKLINKIR